MGEILSAEWNVVGHTNATNATIYLGAQTLWSGRNTGSAKVRLPLTITPDEQHTLRIETHNAQGTVYGTQATTLAIQPQTPLSVFPFDTAMAWTYSIAPTVEPTRVAPLPINNERPEQRILRRDSGYEERFVLNETGLYLEKIDDPTVPFTLAFDPPLQLCADTIVIGESVQSAGVRTDVTPGDEEALMRDYQANVTVAGTQKVDVPAGTFSTFKVQGTIITADAPNILFTLWLAPGVGRVQSIAFGAAPLSLLEFSPAAAQTST